MLALRVQTWRLQLHTPGDTRLHEEFSGKVQIKKVQRRDCSGGGDKSCLTSRYDAFSAGCVAMIASKPTAGAAAGEKLPVRVCASGRGGSEIMQQLLLAFEMVTVRFSACSIAIRSHCVFVWGAAHSPCCECASAQAEIGNGPRPANPSATTKLKIRRIFI